jgi:hypothetical protein
MRDTRGKLVGRWWVVTMLVVVGASSSQATAAPEPQLEGIVQSGGTASARGLANASVRLYEASDGAPRLLGTATSDAAGHFAIAIPDSAADGVRVVGASLDGGIELVAVLGEAVPDFVTVNELTTVAAAFAFAQFFDDTEIRGDGLALSIAAGMNANLVAVATGASSPVLLSTPNGDETNSLRSTRNLANLLAACVQAPVSDCPVLFTPATSPGGPAPTNTIRALVNVARHPALNVAGIFAQSHMVIFVGLAAPTQPGRTQ